MPKTKGGLQSSSQSSYGLVPTESPVRGLSVELATLLVQAIKARRKYLSKSSSPEDAEDDAGKIQNLQNTADDKTTLFLNELKRQVEHSSSTAASSKSSSRSRKVNKSTSDAPTHCLTFLLETLSDGTNSFHLRRSALTLMREILERSSDARIFLASGQHLLDFVSIVERVENDQSDVVEEEAEQNAGASSTNRMSPKSLFQLEAIELIHNLASRFGQFYTQFTVASRLLGDVSVNFSMHNNTNNNSDEGRRLSQSQKVRILRRDRDNALEYGPRACKSIEKMISRADEYFRVLVPRFGGFNTEEHLDEEFDEKISATIASKPAGESGLDLDDMKQDVNQSDDIDDDDSIDWEEGDLDVSDLNDTNEDTNPSSNTNNDVSLNEHQAAVAHTLDIMGRSGALLDGTLAVKVPDGNNSMEGEASAKSTQTPSGLAASTDQGTNLTTEARQKLQRIVQKSSTSRLPRLHRWIHALSYADGMQERVVLDPATASVFGSNGPVSLVLLPEDKRTLRGQLLQQMIKLKGEVEGVLQSAASLGIRPEAVGTQQQTNDTSGTGNTLQNEVSNSPRVNSTVAGGSLKRQWMPGAQTTAATKRKKSKPPRIKVIYRKK